MKVLNLTFYYYLIVSLIWASFPTTILYAAPTGENVISGTATVDRTVENQTIINQATDRAIIQWDGFDIAAPETVTFNQLSAESIALNRVVGGNATQIFRKIKFKWTTLSCE